MIRPPCPVAQTAAPILSIRSSSLCPARCRAISVRLPGGQRPDPGIGPRLRVADRGEERDRALEVVHRLVVAPGRVKQVGNVVLHGGFEVSIPDPPTAVD